MSISHTFVQEALEKSLYRPVEEFLSLSGKRFRARLVEIGCRLTAGEIGEQEQKRCEIAAHVIERIHAGSLIVDDIQDNSAVRRNAPTLHRKYGVATALNAGNWLYFAPLASLQSLGLPPEVELQLHRDCLETLAKAHCGQALDIGVRIDESPQEEVASLCRSSQEWKTGELMGLALRMGAYAAGASPREREQLHLLGKEFGVGLQRFDDAGNFAMSTRNPMALKRHEDLLLRRPSWVWAFAAEEFSPMEYQAWKKAVEKLPNEDALEQWVDKNNFLSKIREGARGELDRLLHKFEKTYPNRPEVISELRAILRQMEEAYYV